ncbi:glycosyltransferase [Pontibacter pudoricolor]|uniref:glycosyltransferase n=1 Tax=Pontibacter pudoricolor TaxID=2694930 RepID=UPI00192F11C2|nr:glycosyltransferase [Pontibacter pudoricolor]
MQYSITASIVAYNNNRQVLLEAITSFLNTTLPVQLYLVDNSPTDVLRLLCVDERLVYIFNNKNIGFGAGHNIAMREALNKAPYHLVLNPDVYFEPGNLEKIYEFMNQHTDVGLLMPKILYPDGELQYLCKLLPTPLQFFERRFMKWNKKDWSGRMNYLNYDLQGMIN